MFKTIMVWIGTTTATTVMGFKEGYDKGKEDYIPKAFEDEVIARVETIQSV